MPIGLHPASKQIFHIVVPAQGPLGENDQDFSNVQCSLWNLDGIQEPSPNVAIFGQGKLGSLNGGMMHLDDARQALSKEDIESIAKTATENVIVAKRWRVGSHYAKRLETPLEYNGSLLLTCEGTPALLVHR